MKRVIATSTADHRSEIYEAFEDCKPRISKAAENLGVKLNALAKSYESDKRAAYDAYIAKCNVIADNAITKLELQNMHINDSDRDYLFKLLVDYADIK